MSEPEEDIACSDLEYCEDKKKKEALEGEGSPSLRKISINMDKLTNSPLKDIEAKTSPLRNSIHELITQEVVYDRSDINRLMG